MLEMCTFNLPLITNLQANTDDQNQIPCWQSPGVRGNYWLHLMLKPLLDIPASKV